MKAINLKQGTFVYANGEKIVYSISIDESKLIPLQVEVKP
jgi:hypothetical protein